MDQTYNQVTKNSKLGLELVGDDGKPIISCPIDVDELVTKVGEPVQVKKGLRIRLEEYNEDNGLFYSEESWNEEGEESDESSSSEDFFEADQANQCGVSGLEPNLKVAVGQEASPKKVSFKQSPEKNMPEKEEKQISRRELWASRAPPMDSERVYKRLQTVPLMPAPSSRRFRLPPLMFHSVASHVRKADRGQRMLVFGGTTNLGKTVESELYEFSLVTGMWRRVEGKMCPPDVYGHASVVIKSPHRFLLIGGVGSGGIPPEPVASLTDDYRKSRFHLLFPNKALIRGNSQQNSSNLAEEKPTLWTLAQAADPDPTFGFLPVFFDMDLKLRKWRVIKAVPKLPVAFHTAVAKGKKVFVFGGLNIHMQVSAQLIVIDGDSCKISLAPPSADSPKARFLHSAVVYSRWIIIYGGFDAHNQPLDDVWAFDTVNGRWEQLDCVGSQPRAGHAACIVGSRLIVVGGFDSSFDDTELPTNSCHELNLVPNNADKHVWESRPIHPELPPLAFATVCPCEDDASFLIYGGCTPAPKGNGAKRVHTNEGKSGGSSSGDRRACSAAVAAAANRGDEVTGDDTGIALWKRVVPSSEGFILTFPVKRAEKKDTESDGPRYNALGVEIDPDEVPAEFQAFVRRQQDFLLKKSGNIVQTMKKISLEEREGMESHLFLTSDEIERLMEEGEEMCERLTEYNMEGLPPYIPERALRLHLNEECISLARQVRDVLKSMKGNPAAAAAVKSKTHRHRSGQKFEDHSAPKPFRRVVVLSLMKEIRKNIKRVRVSNKALKTVEWPQKSEYIESIERMQDSVDKFVSTVKEILDRYIEKRVDSLVAAIETKKGKLKRLAEAVERSRRSTTAHPLDIVARLGECAALRGCSSSRPRCRSVRTRRSKDDSEAVTSVCKGDLDILVGKACNTERYAQSFGDSCRAMIPQPPACEITSAAQPIPVPTGIAATAPNTVWHAGSAKADQLVECVKAFVVSLRSSLSEYSSVGPQEGEGDEKAKEVTLSLASFEPLLECKEELDNLKGRIPATFRESSAAGGGGDASTFQEAQKYYDRLSKSLSVLVQRVKMNLLHRAGARPQTAAHAQDKSSLAEATSTKNSSASLQRPKQRKSHICVQALSLKSPKELEDHSYVTEEESKQPPVGVFTPLGHQRLLSARLASSSTQPVALPEGPKPILITSGRAAALVSAPKDAPPTASGCVIVPSVNGVKVVKNTHESSSSNAGEGPANVANFKPFVPPTSQGCHEGRACFSEDNRPPHVVVSRGPKFVTASGRRDSDAIMSIVDPLEVPQGIVVSDEGKRNLKTLVSINPGFFHLSPSPHAMESSQTPESPRPCESPMIEDDYFFFGRRPQSKGYHGGHLNPASLYVPVAGASTTRNDRVLSGRPSGKEMRFRKAPLPSGMEPPTAVAFENGRRSASSRARGVREVAPGTAPGPVSAPHRAKATRGKRHISAVRKAYGCSSPCR